MKINNLRIYGLEESIIASRYPMMKGIPKSIESWENFSAYKNQVKVAKKLAKTEIGTGHDNFLNGIIVQFDLTCSNKMWVELQRYHFIDFVSSQSTIHRLSTMDLDKCYNEYVDPRIIEIMKEKQKKYIENKTEENFFDLLYNNPSGMELTARMTTNARQLKTIYKQRKTHKLKEWRDFCDFIVKQPNFSLFMEEVKLKERHGS